MTHDVLLMWALVLTAKNLVCVPNITNLHRIREHSLWRKQSEKVDVEDCVIKYIQALTETIKWMDNFLSEQKIFESRPDLRNFVLEGVTRDHFRRLFELYSQVPINRLNELICRELNKTEHKIDFVVFLLSRMNVFNVNLNRQGAMIQQMNVYIQQANAHIQKQNNFIKQQQEQIQQLQAQLNSDRE